MILPFSTQINGKKTHFPEKILLGIQQNNLSEEPLNFGLASQNFKPKLHTIREDKNERWKPGIMIDFFINARQKSMFRFAPRIPVVSIQEIFMTEKGGNLEISIAKEGSYIGSDDKYIYWETKEQLAINDGFGSYDDFQKYFIERIYENEQKTGNRWFSGKIIHWTNLKY